jgi:hypothetical protein
MAHDSIFLIKPTVFHLRFCIIFFATFSFLVFISSLSFPFYRCFFFFFLRVRKEEEEEEEVNEGAMGINGH